MELTIYDPDLDPEGTWLRIVDFLRDAVPRT